MYVLLKLQSHKTYLKTVNKKYRKAFEMQMLKCYVEKLLGT